METPIKKRSLFDILAEKKLLQQQKEQNLLLQESPIKQIEEVKAIPSPIINPTTPKNSLLSLLHKKAEGQVPETSSFHQKTVEQLERLSSEDRMAYYKAEIIADRTKQRIIESMKEQNLEEQQKQDNEYKHTISGEPTEYDDELLPEKDSIGKETFSLSIELNSQQLLAKEMAFSGKSFCLIGAAGTGKTTAQREIAAALLETGNLETHEFRIQGTGERITAPSIAFVAYTRVASGNLRRAIHKDKNLEESLQHNITTIHNLLEYQPETYWNYEENKECFRFTPKRTSQNPLDITHLVIEESSMVGLDLWDKLYNAMRGGVQIIFIGDINQLPPVFGDSILNYALTQLPVIELTHVYRQAGDSTILENAHRILEGRELKEAPDFRIIRAGTVNHTQHRLSITLGTTFPKWATLGEYDPLQDIILSPWNKRDLGTDNMNKWIAQFLGTQRNAIVYEVLAGRSKLYLAVGDKVMQNKMVGIITRISINGRYMGKNPLPSSVNLNRFGTYTGNSEEEIDLEDIDGIDYSNLNLDKMLEDEKGDMTRESSHIVDILMDDGMTVTLSSVGDFAPNSFSLAYALTVHKAQGCEWRKVYFILHRDHAISSCRELFYTAVTRAREQFVIIAKDDVIAKAIKTQRIKGNTVKEKIEYFNSGISLNNAVKCTK